MQQKSGEGLQFQAEMVGTRPQGLVESTQPPPPGAVNFDELGSAVAGAVGFLDDEEAERGGPSGSRWPKQETLALLKIRSEMDAAFREATFKGPLWEEISRKLAELGYKRSSKKCKEKFENVHKYYKRTKEGRAGRQDGKTYRFFTQLEALHGRSGGGDAATSLTAIAAPPITVEPPATFSFTTPPMSAPPAATRIQPFPIAAAASPLVAPPTRLVPEIGQQRLSSSAAVAAAVAGISFSSNSSFSSSSDSDSDEEMAEAGGNAEERKRKRGSTGRPARRQMMAFFEGLMRQVMERQEAMQERFLEAIEKREQERMKREEAWLLQEMARLSREQELLVQERATAASRDAAVISYLQKITGQSITLPTMPSAPTLPLVTSVVPLTSLPSHNPPPAPPPPSNPPQPPPSLQKHEAAAQRPSQITIQTSPASQLTPISSDPQEGRGPGSGGFDAPASSARWPKTEVHALIKLRSELESRYQEAGPKGPLWEEISASMQRLGYNRNSKRCKEKWENINKYFKKVRESNKKRQEDSKTCPYFDQLDALYRRKQFGSAAGGSRSLAAQQQQEHLDTNPTKEHSPLQLHPPAPQDHGKNEKTNDGNSDTGGAVQVPTSNGGHSPSFIEEGMKKPEDIVKELIMEQTQHQGMVDVDYDKMDDETDSENLVDDDDNDDDDDEDSKKQYKIQFQRPNGGNGTAATTTTAAAASSFLAMVQ